MGFKPNRSTVLKTNLSHFKRLFFKVDKDTTKGKIIEQRARKQ